MPGWVRGWFLYLSRVGPCFAASHPARLPMACSAARAASVLDVRPTAPWAFAVLPLSFASVLASVSPHLGVIRLLYCFRTLSSCTSLAFLAVLPCPFLPLLPCPFRPSGLFTVLLFCTRRRCLPASPASVLGLRRLLTATLHAY